MPFNDFRTKTIRLLFFLFGSIFFLFLLFHWRLRDKILEIRHDLTTSEATVLNVESINSVLNSFEEIPYDKLPKDYLDYTKSESSNYKNLLQNLKYYKIKRSDLNRKIVRDVRLKKFICKDKYYKKCVLNASDELICLFNPKIFYKTLLLIETMEKDEYDFSKIDIINGHRHPRYNENVGGAKLSRHIKGEAVDIVVRDINQDGFINQKDKSIVLDLLEKVVIKDEGGIGIYPGTRNLHYDVRGYRARWNTY